MSGVVVLSVPDLVSVPDLASVPDSISVDLVSVPDLVIVDLVSVPDSVSVQSKNLQVSFGLCFGFKSKLFKFRVAFAFSAGNRIRAQRKTRVDRECSNKPR